jgi:hypothetical protein
MYNAVDLNPILPANWHFGCQWRGELYYQFSPHIASFARRAASSLSSGTVFDAKLETTVGAEPIATLRSNLGQIGIRSSTVPFVTAQRGHQTAFS